MNIEKLAADELIEVSGGRENSPKIWAKKIEPVKIIYKYKKPKKKKATDLTQINAETLEEDEGRKSENEIR